MGMQVPGELEGGAGCAMPSGDPLPLGLSEGSKGTPKRRAEKRRTRCWVSLERGGEVGGYLSPNAQQENPRTAQVVPRKKGRAQKEQNVWGSLSVCLLECLLYAQILMSWGTFKVGLESLGLVGCVGWIQEQT